jgi:hypothetical protein
MSDEVGRILKEVVVAFSRYYPRLCLVGLSKTETSVRAAGFPAEICKLYLSNTSLDHDGSTNLFGRQKVKVKLTLCLIKHHAMKMYGGVEV